MTTTELIELLKKHERGGATGRPREVMFEVGDRIIDTDGIEVTGSGDGLISELYLSLPSAQSERLTDDDFETIRIHLNAYKEKLCNQQRWEEADEYQRIIDRFMAFASAQPERKTGQWLQISPAGIYECSECGQTVMTKDISCYKFCHGCGAYMGGDEGV